MIEPNQIYKIVEKECKRKKISQQKLLSDVGLAKSTLDNMKKGSMPSVDKVSMIAEYLGVSIDYLLGTEQDLKSRAADIKRRVMAESNEQEHFSAAPIDLTQKRRMSELHALLSEMSDEDLKKLESYAAFLASETGKPPIDPDFEDLD